MLTLPKWTKNERTIWHEHCGTVSGIIVALASERRDISADFLRTILTRSPWRDRSSSQGHQFRGLRIHGHLNLNDARLNQSLLIEDSEFLEGMSAVSAEVPGGLFLHTCEFVGPLNLERIRIFGPLFIRNSLLKEGTDLTAARADYAIDLSGSKFHGILNLNRVNPSGDLDLRQIVSHSSITALSADVEGSILVGGELKEGFDFGSAKTGRDILIDGASASGAIVGAFAEIGRLLQITIISDTGQIQLHGASVGSHVQFIDSRVKGKITVNDARIAGRLHFHNSSLNELSVVRASISGDIDLSGSKLSGTIDLSETVAGGNFRVSDEEGRTEWVDGSRLELRNARFRSIDIGDKSTWPEIFNVVGLEFERTFDGSTNGSAALEAELEWLGSANLYSPGIYQQLANYYRDQARLDAAQVILIERYRRERNSATGIRWIWLWALDLTVGFGFKPYLAGAWSVPFLILGTIIARKSHVGRVNNLGFLYSLDRFLPIISLSRNYDNLDLEAPYFYYLCLHQIAGYLVGTMLVASLSLR